MPRLAHLLAAAIVAALVLAVTALVLPAVFGWHLLL